MAEHGGANDQNEQGHAERNKVSGEGAAVVSETSATSGGAGELSPLDRDPDAPGGADPGDDPGGPSMATRAADPSLPGRESASFAPGGDKTSQPGIEPEDIEDPSGGRDENPRDFHDRQLRG